jgi:hypothetical protein
MKHLCEGTRFQTLIRPIPDQIRITSMSDHRLYSKLCDAARKAVARYITHAASDYAAVFTVVSSDQSESTTPVLPHIDHQLIRFAWIDRQGEEVVSVTHLNG